MKELPYWWEHAPPSVSESPALPVRADVAVIGSGYTGLSAALTLARAGRSVIVFESDTPGIGASSRNGGMLGSALKPSLGTLTRRWTGKGAACRGAGSLRLPRPLHCRRKHRLRLC
jgi:glycine/D-amino acid oxidase-like deaminating enzyme